MTTTIVGKKVTGNVANIPGGISHPVGTPAWNREFFGTLTNGAKIPASKELNVIFDMAVSKAGEYCKFLSSKMPQGLGYQYALRAVQESIGAVRTGLLHGLAYNA